MRRRKPTPDALRSPPDPDLLRWCCVGGHLDPRRLRRLTPQQRVVLGSAPFSPLSLAPLLLADASAPGSNLTDGAVALASASSQYLSASAATVFRPVASVFSLCGWVKLTDKSVSRTLVAKHDGSSNAGSEYFLGYDKTGDAWNFAVYSGSTQTTVVSTAGSPTVATWYFLAATWDGVNAKLSVNAQVTPDSIAFAGPINSTSSLFAIGAVGASGTPSALLNGSAADCGVWIGHALTAAEITSLYASGSGVLATAWSGVGGLTTATSAYPFTNPTISAAGIGRDCIGSNNLTPQNTPTYAVGPVTGLATADGEAVSQINDLSGNANHFAQATAGLRTTYKTGVQNSRSVARFNRATPNYLMRANFAPLNSACTVLAVVNASATNVDNCILGGRTSASGALALSGNGKLSFFKVQNAQGDTTAAYTTGWHVAAFWSTGISAGAWPGTASWDNGTSASFTQATGMVNTTDTALGSNFNNGADPFGGDIGEVHVFSRVLTATEITLDYLWLKSKWGL